MNSSDTPTYDYIDTVSTSLECPICRSILIDPVMPQQCQHLFCRPCLHRSYSLSPTCPIDRNPIVSFKPPHIVAPPRVVRELLDELKIKCAECDKIMKREQWEKHVEKHEEKRNTNELHEDGVEPNERRMIEDDDEEECQDCHERIEKSQLSSHSSTCPPYTLPCRYCSISLPRSLHPSHLLETCPLVPMPCPHSIYGCPTILPRHVLQSEHVGESGDCPYEPLKEAFERIETRDLERRSENWELRKEVEELKRKLKVVRREGQNSMGEYYRSSGEFDGDDEVDGNDFVKGLNSSDQEPIDEPQPISPSPLVSTLSNLSTRTTSLSTSVQSLAHTHQTSLETTRSLVDEVERMRNVIGGMRMQMGELMRTVQMLSNGRGGGGGGRWQFEDERSRYAGNPWTTMKNPRTANLGMDCYGGVGTDPMRRPPLASRSSDDSSSDPDVYLSSSYDEELQHHLSNLGMGGVESGSDPEEDLDGGLKGGGGNRLRSISDLSRPYPNSLASARQQQPYYPHPSMPSSHPPILHPIPPLFFPPPRMNAFQPREPLPHGYYPGMMTPIPPTNRGDRRRAMGRDGTGRVVGGIGGGMKL